MRCHDDANRLLDCAANGDREAYRAERDRIRRERPEHEAYDAENLAKLQISAWRDYRHFAWRVNWVKQKRGSDG